LCGENIEPGKLIFSQAELAKLQSGKDEAEGKSLAVLEAYLRHAFRSERGREHAHHGFLRRLKTLSRCLDNVYRILPPDRLEPPTSEERYDASISIQAFVLNCFGCFDNLAWIWVNETNLKKEDGESLPNTWVGLGEKNTAIRKSLPKGLQEYLAKLDAEWFKNLESFRHALAHRIPLYIPPSLLIGDKAKEYTDLENRMQEAMRAGDFAEYDRLQAEQDKLETFAPLMTHSYEEGARTIVFHAQLLADFNTVIEVGEKLLGALQESRSAGK
jgi:hypothetical protein